MDTIVIRGGAPLHGEVSASGAKNAVLPLMAATLLASEECVLSNVPNVVDVTTMGRVLTTLGARVSGPGRRLSIRPGELHSTEAPYDLVRTMRASILVLGPLLARYGEARVSLPGGCAIGARPVNLHLATLEKLGAEITIEHGYIHAKAARLRGTRLYLDLPTVTGTENLLMAASLAEGTTIIENAAKEPEVVDLAEFLVKRGAKIHGAGSGVVTIEGVRALRGADHVVIPDRIETGTYLVAAAITGGDVTVRDCIPAHLEAVLEKLREAGAAIVEGKDWVRLTAGARLRGVDIETLPHPGFPTDMQAQMMALMCVVEGTSMITETVFEGRLMHVPELHRMGAEIRVRGHHAVVNGKEALTGASVMASDLRASAGLVLAGLAAAGETTVSRVYHLDRGYERIEEKLRGLGARIDRVKETGARQRA